ncbi:MAG: Essential protein Yae1, N terminal [Cirrosporium novae-zelandiae]|nr:MAG: Essential protein Yae1, N terminal [Cirrosporium novae-zelandiae]
MPTPDPPLSPPDSPSSGLFDDIFGSTPPSTTTPSSASLSSNTPTLRHLRKTHTTRGYRNGTALAKSKAVQPGFDEAFPFGAAIGLRVGFIVGVLRGVLGALRKEYLSGVGARVEEEKEVREMGRLVRGAEEELRGKVLFGERFWAADEGRWVWMQSQGGGDGGGVDGMEEQQGLEDVERHPLVRKWMLKMREVVEGYGIDITTLGGGGMMIQDTTTIGTY